MTEFFPTEVRSWGLVALGLHLPFTLLLPSFPCLLTRSALDDLLTGQRVPSPQSISVLLCERDLPLSLGGHSSSPSVDCVPAHLVCKQSLVASKGPTPPFIAQEPDGEVWSVKQQAWGGLVSGWGSGTQPLGAARGIPECGSGWSALSFIPRALKQGSFQACPLASLEPQRILSPSPLRPDRVGWLARSLERPVLPLLKKRKNTRHPRLRLLLPATWEKQFRPCLWLCHDKKTGLQ